jgi:hypothetical protein
MSGGSAMNLLGSAGRGPQLDSATCAERDQVALTQGSGGNGPGRLGGRD